MSDQKFTPVSSFSSNERDWQAEIGMLPWNTSIVFTKESLVRFLKQVEVEVDTNMTQLKKLPKYASFGTLSDGEATVSTVPSQSNTTSVAPSNVHLDSTNTAFIPTRKVREQPGGGSSQIASLLAGDRGDKDDWVPPPISRPNVSKVEDSSSTRVEPSLTSDISTSNANNNIDGVSDGLAEQRANQVMMPDGSIFVPTRKVREPTGGFSTMGSILSGN
ncbi:hypothetical protein BY996DRAFT_8214507 [Phakopsora pachyrhizi]|uniref:Uncharacterized protein n=1 Tax=Phakopsora pachyrhizi TaxID=170000 RepID=A0AAV0BD97_PHAPC|nr:hypothetical protein BY996DRAFT_8214507 [Phakopsora pachyrhizi]CAH7684453.1 hypothetical protein PPACK8108_LOCUS18602 [Phakopsora pachyrhizi]